MQPSSFVVVLAAVLQLALVASAEPGELSQDVPDCFKAFENFKGAIAITDTNNDTVFECLTVKRLFFDKKTMTTAYVWHFKGHHGNPKKATVIFAQEGTTPDKFFYSEGSDDGPKEEAGISYTDYDNCAVMYMPFHGGQCILWSQPGKQDSLPQECMDQFAKTCGVGVPTYSKDFCDDEELAFF